MSDMVLWTESYKITDDILIIKMTSILLFYAILKNPNGGFANFV